jgi:hypothetical protein
MNEELIEQLNECESANRAALSDITRAMHMREAQVEQKSCKSGHTNGGSHSKGSQNSYSKCSSHSRQSVRSVTSLKAEAAAKAAALRLKLKYMDAEMEHKFKLDKLKTTRDLEIEEAKLKAIGEVQNQSEVIYENRSQLENQSIKAGGRVVKCPDDLGDQKWESALNLSVSRAMDKGQHGKVYERKQITGARELPVATDPECKAKGRAVTLQGEAVNAGVAHLEKESPHSYQTETEASKFEPGLNSRAALFVPSSQFLESNTKHMNSDLEADQYVSDHNTGWQAVMPQNCNYNGTISINQQPNNQTQQVNDLALMFSQLINVSRLPIPEPGVFDGNPLDYPSWKSAFTTLIDCRNISPAERIHYLKQYLAGEAKQCVENFLLIPSNDSYTEALKLIDKRFGDNFTIAQAFKAKIEGWPKIGPKDYVSLRKFSDFLRQCEVAYRSNSSLRVLDDDVQNREMLTKLPDWVVSKWAKRVHKARQNFEFPKFSEFVAFMVEESDIACDPLTLSLNERRVSVQNKSLSLPRTCNAIKSLHCTYCNKDNHEIEGCTVLRQKSYEEKKEFITSKGLCFGCLKAGHMAKNCKERLECTLCKGRHPTAMHGRRQPTNSEVDRKTEINELKPNITCREDSVDMGKGGGHGSEVKMYGKQESDSKHITLLTNDHAIRRCTMIVPVYVTHHSNPTTEVLTYALLDSQSDTSFIDEGLCMQLGIEGIPTTLRLSTMTAECDTIASKRVTGLTVRGFNSSESVSLPVLYSHGQIPANRESIPTADVAKHWPYLRPMTKHLMPKSQCMVGLLIGYNCPRALMPREVIPAVGNGPFAQCTALGWGIVGPIDYTEDLESKTDHSCFNTCDSSFTGARIVLRTSAKEIISPQEIMQFFKREEGHMQGLGLSVEDKRFLSIMEQQTRKLDDNHYEMPLPWREDNCYPENNITVARNRLMSLVKRFKRQPEHYNRYVKFMQSLLDEGYAEQVPAEELKEDCKACYLPHHGVYSPAKPDKLRVVMDASAKFRGKSLNDLLLPGPDLMNSLVGVLCRFRKERVAFICDIQSMFYQFRVCKKDRNFLRFLWFKDNDFQKEIIVLRSTVHLFGVICSPAIANFGLKKAAADGSGKFSNEVVKFINNNFYVDDGLMSINSEREAIKLIEQSMSLCKLSGLKLHKFVCNSRTVLERIAPDVRTDDLKEFVISQEHLPLQLALGVTWCIESDVFRFRVVIKDHALTRRGILSTVCSIFDPLGFIAPVILRGKNILQDMCRERLGWDEPLPDPLKRAWERWITELPKLDSVKVRRCFKGNDFEGIKSAQLHCFSDASLVGYAQCAYLRLEDYHNQVHCCLVQAKSRVAPLKTLTVPRLELSAAVLSSEVGSQLVKDLDIEPIECHFWTDSRIALGFIHNESKRFHTFVANRVQAIRDVTCPGQWHYVATDRNPADLASRGCNVTELLSSEWFRGPKELWANNLSIERESYPLDETCSELKMSVCLASNAIQEECIVDLSRFSSWKTAKRVLALCIRFIENLRAKANTFVTVSDTIAAEKWLFRSAQTSFAEERGTILRNHQLKRTSKLYKLDPFIDEEGLIRIGGRLRAGSGLPYGLRHPIILPKSHRVAELLVKSCHEKTHHQGKGMTINAVRDHGVWVFGLSSMVSTLIFKCVQCRRMRHGPCNQKMADLPEERLEEGPPFSHVGVDCFGPFFVNEGRKEVKRYGVLFTCLVSRAIHIETANSLDSNSFINALRRLLSLRGPIRTLRSDRGTNFVGGMRVLQESIKNINDESIREFLLKNSCDYIVNFPNASHHGGVWERLIRSVRSVLNALLIHEGHILDDEGLRTLLCEAANIVNSRPLAVDRLNDPTSLQPLSPNNLLTMKSNVVLPPPGDFQKEDKYCIKHWRRVQYLANAFWKRWQKEVLTVMQPRSKWNKKVSL